MPTSKPSIACVLLAAGSSSRFGGCKLLADLNGEPVIEKVLNTLLNSTGEINPIHFVSVVTGAYSELIQTGIKITAGDVTVRPVHCPDWREGMGTSLAFGVRSLPETDAIMVMLGDQVLVNASDLRALGSAWHASPSSILCARYQGIVGVPAIFPAEYRHKLESLSGPGGAKKLLNESKDVVPVDMPNAGFDIDTQGDLLRLRRLLARP